MTRRAKVNCGSNSLTSMLDKVAQYLPANYEVFIVGKDLIIEGEDNRGWTLEGYVIPRLSSGLIWAEEIT